MEGTKWWQDNFAGWSSFVQAWDERIPMVQIQPRTVLQVNFKSSGETRNYSGEEILDKITDGEFYKTAMQKNSGGNIVHFIAMRGSKNSVVVPAKLTFSTGSGGRNMSIDYTITTNGGRGNFNDMLKGGNGMSLGNGPFRPRR